MSEQGRISKINKSSFCFLKFLQDKSYGKVFRVSQEICNSELVNFLKPGPESRTFRNFDVGKPESGQVSPYNKSHRQCDFGNVYFKAHN